MIDDDYDEDEPLDTPSPWRVTQAEEDRKQAGREGVAAAREALRAAVERSAAYHPPQEVYPD